VQELNAGRGLDALKRWFDPEPVVKEVLGDRYAQLTPEERSRCAARVRHMYECQLRAPHVAERFVKARFEHFEVKEITSGDFMVTCQMSLPSVPGRKDVVGIFLTPGASGWRVTDLLAGATPLSVLLRDVYRMPRFKNMGPTAFFAYVEGGVARLVLERDAELGSLEAEGVMLY
jgi:hypothetical protein